MEKRKVGRPRLGYDVQLLTKVRPEDAAKFRAKAEREGTTPYILMRNMIEDAVA